MWYFATVTILNEYSGWHRLTGILIMVVDFYLYYRVLKHCSATAQKKICQKKDLKISRYPLNTYRDAIIFLF